MEAHGDPSTLQGESRGQVFALYTLLPANSFERLTLKKMETLTALWLMTIQDGRRSVFMVKLSQRHYKLITEVILCV